MLLNPLSNAFGLDIGDRTFKLAQFQRASGKKGKPRLVAWSTVDVAEGVMDLGEVKDIAKAAAALQQLVKNVQGGRLGSGAVVACLPEAKTFVKIIMLEGDTGDEHLRKAVLEEIGQNIPLPIEEIYYDYQVLGLEPVRPLVPVAEPMPVVAPSGDLTPPSPDAPAPEAPAPEAEPEMPAAPVEPAARPKTRVLLGAAPKKLVDAYAAMLERAGLEPLAFEIEATAISRAIVPEAVGSDAIGILDIGGTRSSLAIVDDGALRMSISIPISGIAITELVSQSLGVSMDDAEKLKRECGLDANRCEDKMWKILQPLIEDMTEKIRNALRFYNIGFPDGRKVERLYLCGGGAQFHEVDSVLSRKLTIKVMRGDAMVNIDPRLPKGFPAAETLQYTTAFGLGLRAAEELQSFRK